MTSLYSILLVGKGAMGSRYAELFKQEYGQLNLVWMGHREIESKSIDEMVGELRNIRPKILGVIIAGPCSQRIKILTVCQNLQIKCLAEKPLVSSTQALEQLNLEFLRSSVVVGYNLRFLKALSIMKEMLDSGVFGELLFVEVETGSALPRWRGVSGMRESVTAVAKLGGGIVLELSHEIDYVLQLFESIEIKSVDLRRLANFTLDTEDFCVLNGEVFGKPFLMKMDCLAFESHRRLKILGTNCEVHWDGIAGTLRRFTLESEGSEVLVENDFVKDTYQRQIGAFLGWVTGKERGRLCNFEEALGVVSVAETIKSFPRSGFS